MISKELLSEVLGIKQFCTGKYLRENCFGYPRVKVKGYPFTLNDDEEFTIRDNELCYGFINTVENPHREVPDFRFINIYELAHRCKEWAKHNYEHTVDSGLHDTWIAWFNGLSLNFTADTEPEAIFQACEWILEQQCK